MNKPVPPDVLIAEEEAISNAVAHVAFYDPLLERDLAATGTTPYRKVDEEKPNPLSPKGSPRSPARQKSSTKVILTAADQSNRIKTFCRFLSICHEAVPENLEDGSVKISAPNPDDEALVCAGAYFGYEFKDRKKNVLYIFEKETQRLLEIEVFMCILVSTMNHCCTYAAGFIPYTIHLREEKDVRYYPRHWWQDQNNHQRYKYCSGNVIHHYINFFYIC